MFFSPTSNCSFVTESDETAAIVDAHHYYRAVHRAIGDARRQLFMTGWQFHTEVQLVRGVELENGPVTLIERLLQCLNARPELEVYILAWEYSAMFAIERQWGQKLLFGSRHPRMHFLWDSCHPPGASHHQKIVTVDGSYAFTGGMDVCQDRWDTRAHHLDDQLRVNPDGHPVKPYHDVQTYVAGPAAERLASIFVERWLLNGGAPLSPLVRSEPPMGPALLLDGDELPLPSGEVAVAQTVAPPEDHAEDMPQRHEVRQLYADMVGRAERFIYIENQYFTSRSLTRALIERLEDDGRPRIEVVMILPQGGDTPKEQLALGDAQSFALQSVRKACKLHGHTFRLSYTGRRGTDGDVVATFIHSKVMVVDDEYLTIGSANATNRSFGHDSELNLAWQARDDEQRDQVRRLRVSLLAEHTGTEASSWLEAEGMVDGIDGAWRAGRIPAQMDVRRWTHAVLDFFRG